LQSVHSGHVDVGENQIHRVGVHDLQRFLSVTRFMDGANCHAGLPEHALQDLADRGRVIHD